MKRALGGFAFALFVSACAADPPPKAIVATTLPPPAHPSASLLHVDGATFDAPKKDEPRPWGDDVAWRSQGANEIAYGTDEGVLFVSATTGVQGFFRYPASAGALRWAGFVKDDAVLMLVETRLVRAASVPDLLAGKMEELPIAPDRRLDIFASNGDLVVFGARDGSYFESTNGGRKVAWKPLPSKEPLLQLVVRDDGLILAAFETGRKPGKYGGTTIHAQTWIKKKPNLPWQKSALVEGHDATPVEQSGAVIEATRITDDVRFDGDDGKNGALDAKGNWIDAPWTPRWMQLWPSPTFEPAPPQARPTMPTGKNDDDNVDLVGGLMGSECRGVACLSHREYLAPTPHAYVLDDSTCDPSSIVDHEEDVYDAIGTGAKHTVHRKVCDETKPAARTATLVLTGAGLPKTVRLPSWCPSGTITGSDLFPLIHCDTRYSGKGVLVSFDDHGRFAEAGPLPIEAGWRRRAERSADGTTIVRAEDSYALCDPKTRKCNVLEKDGTLLAARPLDGGRAIVASPGPTPDVVVLALVIAGAVTQPLATARVEGNLVDFGVTPEGNVKLVTSARAQNKTGRWPEARRAWLVRTDGSLTPAP